MLLSVHAICCPLEYCRLRSMSRMMASLKVTIALPPPPLVQLGLPWQLMPKVVALTTLDARTRRVIAAERCILTPEGNTNSMKTDQMEAWWARPSLLNVYWISLRSDAIDFIPTLLSCCHMHMHACMTPEIISPGLQIMKMCHDTISGVLHIKRALVFWRGPGSKALVMLLLAPVSAPMMEWAYKHCVIRELLSCDQSYS